MPQESNMGSSRISINMIANLMQFSLRFLLGIWFTRFLIQSLSTPVYGIIPLGWNLVNYLGLITIVLNAPTGRYLIIEISKGNIDNARLIFNTVLHGVIILCFFLLLITTCISWYLPHVLNIPSGYITQTKYLFLSISSAFIFSTLGNPFSLATYVTNNLFLRSINEAIQQIIRVSISVIFIYLGYKLGGVSIGIFISAIIGFIITIFYWKKLTPELKIKIGFIDFSLLKEISSMGAWMFVNKIGSLLFLNSELIVVNLLYGAKMTGIYGAILLFPSTLRNVSQMLASNLTPPIMDRYVRKGSEELVLMLKKSIKYLGILIALPLGLLCGFSKPILKIWLGNNFGDYAILLIILSAHLAINLAILPLFPVQVLLKKVALPGIITLLTGIANIVLAIILGLPKLGLGITGIALAGAIVLTGKNTLFTSIYSAILLKKHIFTFFSPLKTVLMLFIFTAISSYCLANFFKINNLSELIINFLIVSSIYILIVWTFIFNSLERQNVKKTVQGIFI